MTSHELTNEQRDWIEQTLLNLKHGNGNADDTEKLRALLLESKEARSIYLRLNQMDCLLGASYQRSPSLPPLKLQTTISQKPKSNIWIPALVGAGIAAMVAFIFSINWLNNDQENIADQPEKKSDPVAELQSEHNARFNGDAAAKTKTFDKGELFLDRGIAQLAFKNGTQVVLDGKCDFEILDKTTVLLTRGKMWLYCPAQASGFKVRTPDKEINIHPGSEFGTEITALGATDTHVYRGLVKISDTEKRTKTIVTGEAILWKKNAIPPRIASADFEKFTTSADITKARLRAHHKSMLTRNDLLLYYDFTGIKKNTVFNKSPNSLSGSSGLILGATPVSGRIGENSALQFENPGAKVRLHAKHPDNVQAFTMALWVKIDRLPTALSTLINSNGWEPGSIHFQVTRNGSIKTGINGVAAFESPSSSFDTGRWHLFAATWNFRTRKADLYCDGVKLKSFRVNNGTKPVSSISPQLGICQIGSWQADMSHTAPKNTIYLDQGKSKGSSTLKQDVRDLKGRVDEVMIFNRNLSQQELLELYTNGKP